MSDDRRLGRAVLRLLQHEDAIADPVVRASLDNLLLAAHSMDFAVRLREFGSSLTPTLALQFASQAGIGVADLRLRVLPVLSSADVVDFSYQGAELRHIEEFVGVSASVLDQVVAVLNALSPGPLDWAILHSVEIASWAPLAKRDHLEQLVARGFTDQDAETALNVALAARISTTMDSTELREPVVFSPYVWGSEAVEIAGFLKSLPSEERTVLVSVCEQATARPGMAASAASSSPAIVAGARKVGLLQAATVKSTSQGAQTYLFSPLLDSDDNALRTTEALHGRKLFVAHILFGHERARASGGRIRSPVVLVNSLLKRGHVGPASNIGTDYHLLEAAGIVRVESSGSKAILEMVKEEIVRDSLDILRRLSGDDDGDFEPDALGELRPPRSFISPERDRLTISSDAASGELFTSAVFRLREEAARAARHDSPF